jgi:hypothetical protein
VLGFVGKFHVSVLASRKLASELMFLQMKVFFGVRMPLTFTKRVSYI